MYYPGLFESATPFPGLNPHPFKTDSLPPSAGEQHVDLITLTDKKMAGNLSTSSLASPVLTTLTSPFRGPPHFGSPHYRPQTGDLMASPYMTSSAPHLAANDNLNPSLLHEQSFLEASTPYGIGPLPSYPHYPNYMGNSVLNPTLANKGSPSTGYPPHGSSFYPSSGPSYPSLYPDSFISEYIVRNHHHHHIDSTNKAPAYNAPVSDNNNGERRDDATGQEKIKKTCKRQLWNPDGDEHDDANDKKKDVKENEKAKPKVKAPSKNEDKTNNNNNKKMKKDTIEEIASPKETKPSKKSNGNGRRRRFRSGLDMIRSSRKKSANKTRSPAKKDNKVKKDLTAKDLRLDSKRLIVNKSLGETMLHRSARNNRLDVVKQCLLLECDVNVRDNAGYTPLHECSSRGNLEVARLLLQHSADVNASATGGIRPLHDAIENNHIELVRLLLSYGADPNISTYSGSTPLQLCRSKMMFKFLKGFQSDIGTERPVIDSTTLPWKFINHQTSGESGDYVENGFDIFADVPSDGEDCENVFHFGERPIVPSYCPIHNYNSPFYLLSDVLAATGLSEAEFKRLHSNVEITKITKTDFMKATLSQLEQRLFRADSIDQDELSIIERNDTIDEILNISTTVI
ncbi:hypothetical protein BLOT_007620 [Blomia tropicalis]|nr:hypothetical protein BLOT_007620 [Blomia tropicalis]